MHSRLKIIRKTLGLTQAEVAKQLALDRSYYSQLETGKSPLVSRWVNLITKLYNVNREWFETGEGEMFAPSNESEQEIAEKFLLHKIHQLPEDCKKELLNFCIRLLKAESKNF